MSIQIGIGARATKIAMMEILAPTIPAIMENAEIRR
jgi:hypothetical protein